MRKSLLASILLAAGALLGLLDGPSQGDHRAAIVATTAIAADVQPTAAVNRPANARPDLAAKWLDENGRYRFPPNDGFKEAPQEVTLAPGTLIDRYGQPGGRFLSPAG